jgi:hypothetical protein
MRQEANRTPPLPGGNPFLSGDDSRSGAPSPSPMGGNAARVPLVDPVARAAAAAATKAEAAARREMLAGAEKSKAEILRAMEETDARIASLELSIAEFEDRERSDREQMDEQRQAPGGAFKTRAGRRQERRRARGEGVEARRGVCARAKRARGGDAPQSRLDRRRGEGEGG